MTTVKLVDALHCLGKVGNMRRERIESFGVCRRSNLLGGHLRTRSVSSAYACLDHMHSSVSALPSVFMGTRRRRISGEKYRYATCASANEDDQEKSSAGVDWDVAWKRFKKNIPEVESNTTTTSPPPRFVRKDGFGAEIKDEIRRSERSILEAWTSESFSQAAIICVVLIFIVLITLTGGVSEFDDGRCTLPWC